MNYSKLDCRQLIRHLRELVAFEVEPLGLCRQIVREWQNIGAAFVHLLLRSFCIA
jgi:hypothetical protein